METIGEPCSTLVKVCRVRQASSFLSVQVSVGNELIIYSLHIFVCIPNVDNRCKEILILWG